jgi:16S rRNA (cytosine1402-N4)-methyltransferase
MPKQKQKDVHIPVLLQEVLNYLDPKPGQSYLDLTAGYGGHAVSIIEATGTPEQAILVDRDEKAVQSLRQRFTDSGVKVVRSDFLSALTNLTGESQKFDMVLADLGVSSPHLKNSEAFRLVHQGRWICAWTNAKLLAPNISSMKWTSQNWRIY